MTIAPLQAAIESVARHLPGRLGCVVCSGRGDVWAACRPDEEFATASLIKVPIAVATAAEVEAGRLHWEGTLPPHLTDDAADSGIIQYLSALPYTIHDLLFLMLAVSDNRATNLLIHVIGMEQLNAFFARWWPRTRLTRHLGDFDARARGLENTSTPREMADVFLGLLGRRSPLSKGAACAILQALKAQVFRDRLPARLPRRLAVANKTGDMPGVENDAGVIYIPETTVVAAVFTNDLSNDVAGRLAIQEIGWQIYQQAAG